MGITTIAETDKLSDSRTTINNNFALTPDQTATETISGLWSFSNALGLKTNIITERTAGAGVTIDGITLKGGTNTFNIANGTASLDIAAGAAVNIDKGLTINGQAITITGITQANTLTLNESFTIGDGYAGTLTFSGSGKTLTIEDTSVLNQDLSSDASPTFAGLTMAGNIAMGDNSVTGINALSFTDVDGTIAGIANKNLLSRIAAETITNNWTYQKLAGSIVENFITYSANSGHPSLLNFKKSHQDTAGHTATVNTELIAQLLFYGNSGSGFTPAAGIEVAQSGAAGTYTPAEMNIYIADGTNWGIRYVLGYNSIQMANGTVTAAAANSFKIGSTDLSAGNTQLSLYGEGTCIGTGTPTADRTVAVKINGTQYYLLASTSAS